MGCVISGLLKPHLQVNITGREGSTRSGGRWALQFPTWGGVRSGGITIVISLVDASWLILIPSMTWTTKFPSDAKCHDCCRTVRGGAEPDEEALKQTFESSPQPAGGNSEDGKQPLGSQPCCGMVSCDGSWGDWMMLGKKPETDGWLQTGTLWFAKFRKVVCN